MKTYEEIYKEYGMCVANIARAYESAETDEEAVDIKEISEDNVKCAQEEVERVKHDYTSGNPAIFVITYHKYNEGRSLAGMWIDLTAFDYIDELNSFCHKLHSDEEDPELMVVDYESFPDDWYSESYDADELEKVIEWAKLDETQREMYEAYISLNGGDATFDDAEERYCGQWDSDEDFAENLVEELGYEIPSWLENHIDWESVAREFMYDYEEENGYYFRRY